MRKAVHRRRRRRRIKVSVCGSTLYIFRPGLILTCPILLILCSNYPTVLKVERYVLPFCSGALALE